MVLNWGLPFKDTMAVEKSKSVGLSHSHVKDVVLDETSTRLVIGPGGIVSLLQGTSAAEAEFCGLAMVVMIKSLKLMLVSCQFPQTGIVNPGLLSKWPNGSLA